MNRNSLAAAAVLTIVMAGCARPPQPRLDPLTAAEISGERLWKRITQESDYKAYSFLPGHEGVKPGQSPHGRLHRVYMNNTLESSLPVANRLAPPGTILVKENLTPRRDLDKITVMTKVPGFDADTGDWFWAAFGADGTVLAEGALESCAGCHEGVRNNDYLVIHRLDAPLAGE